MILFELYSVLKKSLVDNVPEIEDVRLFRDNPEDEEDTFSRSTVFIELGDIDFEAQGGNQGQEGDASVRIHLVTENHGEDGDLKDHEIIRTEIFKHLQGRGFNRSDLEGGPVPESDADFQLINSMNRVAIESGQPNAGLRTVEVYEFQAFDHSNLRSTTTVNADLNLSGSI